MFSNQIFTYLERGFKYCNFLLKCRSFCVLNFKIVYYTEVIITPLKKKKIRDVIFNFNL